MRVAGEAWQARNLASTINVGAFNFGNAVGAWIGAVALIHGEPYDRLPWIGAALAAVALVLTVVSYRLDGRNCADSVTLVVNMLTRFRHATFRRRSDVGRSCRRARAG